MPAKKFAAPVFLGFPYGNLKRREMGRQFVLQNAQQVSFTWPEPFLGWWHLLLIQTFC